MGSLKRGYEEDYIREKGTRLSAGLIDATTSYHVAADMLDNRGD